MNSGIIFEVIPNAKASSESYAKRALDRITAAISGMKNVSMLNIPEIAEENHIGLPYYKNIDGRKFAAMLAEKCGREKEIIVNTVAAHYSSKEKFEEWLDESIEDYGIKNFVFVGQKINSIKYPGPSVAEANLIAKEKKINFGNIFIPERESEVERLLGKTASGCGFFTSQVLFEAEKAVNAIKDYSIKCKSSNLKPAKFYLSLAPLGSAEDIDFIKWLGAEISERTEKRLRSADELGGESIKVILETIEKIFGYFEKTKIDVPLGLNIEYIALHNLELSKELVNMAAEKLEKYIN